jgi:hypothetical protein
MATIYYDSGGETYDLAPGEVRDWFYNSGVAGKNTNLDGAPAISVTAYPVLGNPNDDQRRLAVENISIDGRPDGGLTLTFSVRNVGDTFMPGYYFGIAFILP